LCQNFDALKTQYCCAFETFCHTINTVLVVLLVKNPYYTLFNQGRVDNKKMINIDFVKLKDAYKNIKKEQKLTQADLSKRCGWSKNAFGMFLNEKTPLNEKNLIKGKVKKKIMWDGEPWVIPVGVHYICIELEKNERLQASKQKMVIVQKGKKKFEVVEACKAIKLDCDYRFYLIGLAFPKFAPNKD